MKNELKQPTEETFDAPKKPARKLNLYALLDPEKYLNASWFIANRYFLVFILALMVLYIGNSHYAINTQRNLDKTADQIKELKWEYITFKSELMYKSKQTEVAKIVEPLGLTELKTIPKVIKADDGDY